jgi:hypothetical protein
MRIPRTDLGNSDGVSRHSTLGGEMKKFAMIGYYHDHEGGVYAVGNEDVTLQEAKERAAKEGLALFQLFPLQGKETGQRQFKRRLEDGTYNKQGRSREVAARLSGYVGNLIEKDEANH